MIAFIIRIYMAFMHALTDWLSDLLVYWRPYCILILASFGLAVLLQLYVIPVATAWIMPAAAFGVWLLA